MPRHAVLMADMNFLPASPEYDRFAGPVSADHGRLHRRDRFLDAWVLAGHPEEEGVTRPAEVNPLETAKTYDKRIDFIFVTTGLADRIRSAHIDIEAIGSDHRPFWAEIDLDDPAAPLSG